MKQYKKVINAQLVIKSGNQIVIKKNGMQIINPTEDMILADGWVEYVIPKPAEETEEQKLNRLRDKLKQRIEMFDTSPEVNEFYVGDMPMWLDKATRAGLLLRFQAEQAMGLVDTTLWYNGSQFPLKVEQAIQMLYAIELYASACYDKTQEHLANVGKLETIEEIEAYDYRIGYPEKLRF